MKVICTYSDGSNLTIGKIYDLYYYSLKTINQIARSLKLNQICISDTIALNSKAGKSGKLTGIFIPTSIYYIISDAGSRHFISTDSSGNLNKCRFKSMHEHREE